ncbi:hypothetical protein E3N88_25001 [Mikania micrantha]|uniref:Protein kinase domain-containing protein n=1 Tax=Mikania micrantha TaxID=192012 RepID=A0A5N6N4T4_9ASTR|nr:hypothetical protein E3N88_25001 [Mikania micrantha]
MTTPSSASSFSVVFIIVVELFVVNSQQFLLSERNTLLNLRQQWRNPVSLTHWNASSSSCGWPEITCNTDGSNAFVGRLPDDIDRLSRIEYVDLGANNFTGDIPTAIGNLSSLMYLQLYQNLFDGLIPSEIGNLSNLLILGLAYNGFASPEIPPEFGKLRNLKKLWMPGSNLIGKIPESFGDLSDLELLDLSSNKLEGEIPSGLFLLKNLSNLYLYKNNLSGEIPSVIESVNLTEIDISMNKITGSIPEDFGKLQQLEVLNLFSNQLSGSILPSISQIPALRIFRLFRNNLTGELPSEIGLHSKLEAFEVSENKLTGKLPENLCGGGTLSVVVAFSNNLTGEIPRSLQTCDKLHTIQLYDNSFTGEFPSGIWSLSNLTSLRIAGNYLSGELPTSIPWSLSRLEISDNKFSGRIPEAISLWTKLNVFKASNNLLSGEIPTGFTSLSLLSVVYLDGNSLSGTLPVRIRSWNSLTTLNLARNNLSGEIPVSITSLPNLLELDLSENQLSGKIPTQLSRLRLTSLNLSSNNLTGRIPYAFDNLAYENSFLNNPELCSSTPIPNLQNCHADYTKSPHSHKFSPKIIAMIVVSSAFISLVTILCTLFMFRGYLKKKQKLDLTTWKLTSFHTLKFTEANILCCLTDNNLIGSGGSGKVYQIEIGRVGEYVAVKRIWTTRKMDHTLEKEFLSEVQILGSIRHSNIVKLLCCFSSEDSKLLVYEYMENQSLDKWLHGKKMKTNQYAYSTTITDRVDVYSFGVVLLELVTGKEPHEGDVDMNLAEWTWKHFSEGNSMVEALDPEIKQASCYMEEISLVFKLGLICTSTLPSSRPSMKEVLEILRRCDDPLSEERKVGEDIDVTPLLRRESYLSNYRHGGNKVANQSIDIFDGRL